MHYKALTPDLVIDRLKEDFETAIKFSLKHLENIYNAQAKNATDDSVWTINGVKNVNDKMIYMLESASEVIIFASSYAPLEEVANVYPIMGGIGQVIQKKIREGVQVKMTGSDKKHVEKFSQAFPEADVKMYSAGKNPHSHKGGLVVIDDKEALVVTLKDDAVPPIINATWYNGQEHVSIFNHFIEAEWETSKSIDRD